MADSTQGIEFEVRVNDGKAVTANSKIISSNEAVEGSFRDIDSAAKKTGDTLESSSNKAGRSMGRLGKNAGQAGIQVQQFVGQIQGGQSAMLALSQQAADLGFVLGYAGVGAAVGIAATAISFLTPLVTGAADQMSLLKESSDRLKYSFAETSDGTIALSREIEKLAKRSESLAKLQISTSIVDAQNQISAAISEVIESVEDMEGIFTGAMGMDTAYQTILTYSGALDEIPDKIQGMIGQGGFAGLSAKLDEVSREFGVSRQSALEYIKAIGDVKTDKSAVAIKALENQLGRMNAEAGGSSEKINELSKSLLPLFNSVTDGVDRSNLLRQAFADLDRVLEESGETSIESKAAFDSLSSSINTQIIALQSGSQAAEVYAATQKAVEEGTQEQLPAVIELIDKKYELIRAQALASESARAEAAAIREDEAAYRAFLKAIEEGEAAKAAREKVASSNIDAFKQSLMTEEQLRAAAYVRELEQFRESAELLGMSKDEIRKLELEKAAQHAEKLIAIQEKVTNKELMLEETKKQAKLSMVSSMFGNLSSLMNTESRKMFEIGKAAAVSQAVVDGYAAVSKTMASTPYPWNIPLAAAQSVASFAQVKGIMSTSYGSAGTGQSYSGGQVATNTTAASAGAQAPNRTFDIRGLNPSDMVSGQQVYDLLKALAGDGYDFNFIGG